ncbi:MAG: adenylate/guanylate cyclase domain-containing protein [Gemmatimonadota bacterium]
MECGQPLPPEAKFCPGCGTRVPEAAGPAPTAEPPPGPPAASTEPPLPAELRAKFESTRAELRGDRREVVVLFADVSGYTSMSEGMDPEEVSLLMQGLMRELAEAVYRYEGYVDKYIGDAIMALFGAPLAHENDAERAVLTALEMIEIIRRRKEASAHPIALRVGLNLGEVVAAHMGSDVRLQYTVMGDTVNVASRLESAAEPNTVLASESVYERIAHKFETEEVPPLTVKGKSEPLRPHRILRYRSSREPSRGSVTAFVGREKELAALEDFLAEIRDGEPDVMLVEANAGAGKSRLIREALSRSGSGLKSIQVEFTQIELPGQLPAVAEIFRQLAASVYPGDLSNGAQAAEALREYLGEEAAEHEAGLLNLIGLVSPTRETPASAFEIDAETARQARWLALVALLVRSSRDAPPVIVFEDVHWMGEEPSEFLAFLLPRLSAARIGAILTARPGTSGPWLPPQIRRLFLDRLSELDARSILGDLFNELRPQERRELIRRSEGNPLYLEELARSMRESLETAATSVPGTLQGLLQSRIDRLPPPVQAALQMAAVLGSRFSTGLLGRMYQLEAQSMTSEVALRALEEKGFLEAGEGDGDQRRFRHPLMQEVAYGGLLLMVRKILHESAARLGEEFYSDRFEAEAPFFAHHYWRAGLKVDAAPHLWKAGLSSARNFELLTAEKYLSRFAGIIEEEPVIIKDAVDRAHFEEVYGKILLERNEMEAARSHFERLRELGESEGRTEWTVAGIMYAGQVASALGNLDEAKNLYEQGMSFPLGEKDEQLVADLHNCLGNVYSAYGEADRALREHEKALEIRERIGDRRGISKSLINIGFVFMELTDDLARAEDHFHRALNLTREIGDRQLRSMTLNNLGRVAIEKGEWKHALTRFQRMEELAEELGWPLLRYMSLRNQAYCELSLGHIDSALRNLRICTEKGDNVLVPAERFFVRAILFETYLRALAGARAEGALREAEEILDEHELEELTDILLVAEGRWLTSQREWEKATGVFAQAAEAAQRVDHRWNERLALMLGYRSARRAGLHPPRPPDPPTKIPWESALLGYLRADAEAADGPSPEVLRDLQQAGDIAGQLGEAGLERAAFERLAELLGRMGDHEGQTAAARRAMKAMEVLEQHLPDELRDAFVNHPRNVALREAASVGSPVP